MKSKIIEKEVEEKVEYPCLMKSKKHGHVILFTDLGNGVVVSSSDDYRIGQKSDFWDMACFEPFNGIIELSN